MAALSLTLELESLKRRLYRRVAVDGDCVLFMGCRDRDGYGQISVGGDGKQLASSRAAWLVHFGDIAAGLCVCHRCDVPACINPAHLFLGTKADNAKDMRNKSRSATGSKSSAHLHPDKLPRGERHGMSKLTARDVQLIRDTAGFLMVKEAASIFGVTSTLIGLVIRRKIWRHVD